LRIFYANNDILYHFTYYICLHFRFLTNYYILKKGSLNSEISLVQRLKESDKPAFELIFNKFSKKLYYFTLSYVHSQAETEEIIQNVFVALWENRDMLSEAFPIQNYLYKVTINHIYNYFKHQLVRRRYAENIILEGTDEDQEAMQGILTSDLGEIVNKIIDELPLRQQVIFRLSRTEGLCHAEIAHQLGLSVRSVENQIYRALKYIREKLNKESILAE
jgi:RNA polymerase sigma-70 factor (ECF subfamily)